MEIVKADYFIDSIRGVCIEDGEVSEGGLHLYLSNGRVLIFLEGLVYVGEFERTLQ
jgi:hypothetical protein